MSRDRPAAAHLRQALHNEALAERLTSEGAALDWVVTACFYSALHYLDHWCEARGIIVADVARRDGISAHAARSRLAREHLERADEVSYRALRIQSEVARYVVARNGATRPVTAADVFGEDAAAAALRTLRSFRSGLGYVP